MKTSFTSSSMVRVTVCLSCLVAGAGLGSAQQTAYGPQPQSAPSYYPPQQPSAMERIRSTGQSVGNFIRRKFYGESAPTSYAPPPVYRSPGGSYQAKVYNLDAPARPAESAGSGTGFQRPTQGSTPKYVTPPTSAKAESRTSTASTSKTTKSSPPSVAASAPTASKKRYTPAKPSTFSKPKTTPKPAPEPVTPADEPPAPLTAPTLPEPPKYEAPAPVVGSTEAKLNKDYYPLPGAPEPAPTTTGAAGISLTVGGAEPDLTPKTTEPEATIGKTEAPTTTTSMTTDVGSKSSGSFLVGKKTSKVGRVVSPYPPYNELDITGLPSGSLALDPTTQKVFEVP